MLYKPNGVRSQHRQTLFVSCLDTADAAAAAAAADAKCNNLQKCFGPCSVSILLLTGGWVCVYVCELVLALEKSTSTRHDIPIWYFNLVIKITHGAARMQMLRLVSVRCGAIGRR